MGASERRAHLPGRAGSPTSTLSSSRLPTDDLRLRLLARGVVVAEPGRCVQCGLCSYNCPMGVDPRSFARAGAAVLDRRCILCGECVARCPRGTLAMRLEDVA